jgi:hypothetical protein
VGRINPGVSNKNKSVPREKSRPVNKSWTFSLSYWRQIENFGLKCEAVDENWYVSLLERLQILCGLDIEEVARNGSRAWRYHAINWNQKGIPIKKTDLDWVPDKYLHSEEIEFYQLQISQAKGRIIGFLDFENVFQIVLLDPMHNAQPSKNHGYAVNKTEKQVSTYQDLASRLILIKDKINHHCPTHLCKALPLTDEVHSAHVSGKHVFMDDIVHEEIEQISQDHNYDDILDLLVDALDALKNQKAANKRPSSPNAS